MRRESEKIKSMTMTSHFLRPAGLSLFLLVPVLLLSARPVPDRTPRNPVPGVIVTGQNNHNWPVSSEALRRTLEGSGLFWMDLAVSPTAGEDMSGFSVDFSRYRFVVLDYNGDSWSAPMQEAFLRYVRGGGGVVIFHAADNAFPEWEAYNRIIALGGWGGRDERSGPYRYWKDGRLVKDTRPGPGGSHGARHAILLRGRCLSHPVVQGLPADWLHAEDELYDRLRGPGKIKDVLYTAWSDPEKGGSGREEPLVFTVKYGRGRILHIALGHAGPTLQDNPSMQCAGLQTLLLRGAQWCAREKVSRAVPPDFPTASVVSLRKDYRALPAPRHIIFDTDWWTDVDDACAIRTLLQAEREGKVRLEGICLSAVRATSVPSLSSFLASEGRRGVFIGADKEATDYPGTPSYHQLLIDACPQCGADSLATVADAVGFYRKILSEADGQVDIVTVGFMNALSRLLLSGPDKYSPLSGEELVRQKVRHLWSMAGKYPEGKEYNFANTERSRRAGAVICAQWPTDVTFLGYEIGTQVRVGGKLPEDDLLHRVLTVHGSASGRYAWDPMLTLMACLDSPEEAGFETVRGRVTLDSETGCNHFASDAGGPHAYVRMVRDSAWFAARFRRILGEDAGL